MRFRRASWAMLLAVILGCALAARAPGAEEAIAPGPLRLAWCDDLLRPPLLLRCRIERDVSSVDHDAGPYILQASLEHGGRVLATAEEPLAHLGQLRDGVSLVLAPDAIDPAHAEEPALLSITLANPSRTRIERITRTIQLPRALARELDRTVHGMSSRGERDPLPWLWAEQGQELVAAGVSAGTCRGLAGILDLLRGWESGKRAADADADAGTIAFRDPTDDSVQPERHHRPSAMVGQAYVFAGSTSAPRKSAWPLPPWQWLPAAAAAGIELIECYPAGDLAWDDIAVLRAESRLRQPVKPGAPARVALVGQGRGAAAAVRLACLCPERVASVDLVDPLLPTDAPLPPNGIRIRASGDGNAGFRAWRERAILGDAPPSPDEASFWIPAPAPAFVARAAIDRAAILPALSTRMTRYAEGPFVIVVGTREHAAAQADNHDLAQRFTVAWAAHAHGLPRRIDDTAFDPRSWRGYHLVLIGNPRSNRVLADLVADGLPLPASWDSRRITVTTGTGVETWLRSERRALALVSARPRDPAHVVVVLDGAPSWSDAGLPLSGLPDISISPPASRP